MYVCVCVCVCIYIYIYIYILNVPGCLVHLITLFTSVYLQIMHLSSRFIGILGKLNTLSCSLSPAIFMMIIK